MAISSPETKSTPTAGAAGVNDFPYGWRYVRRTLENGVEVVETVPLTRADLLHPQEEDVIVHSSEHERTCTYLQNVLEACLSTDPTAVVLRDVRVAWDTPAVKPLGPDLVVIFGVREQKNWSTFDVVQEGTRPALVIEVTSPETRSLDLVDKADKYDIVGVPLYIIVDFYERQAQTLVRLLGYQQSPNGYTPLALNEQGQLWLEPVSIWIGIAGNRVQCYDTEGNVLLDYVGLRATLIEAEKRLAVAEARAAQAEAYVNTFETRLQALEAEMRRLRREESAE